MPPGVPLTALTEETWQRGLDRLTDDELIGVLRAARRLASRAAALELSVVADLAARRRAEPGTRGGPSAGEHVDAEVAAALTVAAAGGPDVAQTCGTALVVGDGVVEVALTTANRHRAGVLPR